LIDSSYLLSARVSESFFVRSAFQKFLFAARARAVSQALVGLQGAAASNRLGAKSFVGPAFFYCAH